MSDEEIVPGSLQAYITADIRKQHAQEIEKVPVPRFNGRLVLRCQSVDPRTVIRIGLSAEENPDPVEGVIMAAVEALLASCVGTETDKGDDLGYPLGAALAGYLGLVKEDEIISDREAVLVIFGDESEIVEAAAGLRRFQQAASKKVSENIVGN